MTSDTLRPTAPSPIGKDVQRNRRAGFRSTVFGPYRAGVHATVDANAVLSITTGFLLDQVRTGRQPMGLTDALILITVTQANVEALMRSSALQAAYATYRQAPPDELRRPISVNAVAQSLRLPYETVRRRVNRLVLLGLCCNSPEGLLVPSRRLAWLGHRQVLEAAYRRLSELHGALAEARVLLEGAAPPMAEPLPLRAAARLSSEYLLRIVALATEAFGDAADAAIWFEVFRSNTEHDPRAARLGSESGRRAVTIATVARRLGVPAETVRRRLNGHIARGSCVWVPGGLVVPDAALESPAVVHLADRNLVDLKQMYVRLAAVTHQVA